MSSIAFQPFNEIVRQEVMPEPRKDQIEILDSLEKMRKWRELVRERKLSVGFVPTMGALHAGHISLVKRSLAKNDLTIVSIFVNPAQFAPHEDLATYPRTLPHDLEMLSYASYTLPGEQSGSPRIRTPSAVFLPQVKDMYPSGIVQNVADQKGTFVEVKGFSHQMEGGSRPTFFRGVATVVTKLFNAVQPTRAYFGQKDIQQALLLKRMSRDLLLANPLSENISIVPTYRDPKDGLAFSSRNAYLSPKEREVAGCLYASLKIAEEVWQRTKRRDEAVNAAVSSIDEVRQRVIGDGVVMKVDYIEVNNPETFEVVEGGEEDEVIISGALWVGKTRLIDNLIVGGARQGRSRIIGEGEGEQTNE